MSQTAHGIDISKWQGAIDWNALAAAHTAGQVDFIIMRAGYGYATTDPRFEEYYREASSRGIPCGAYWYAYWKGATPTQEANAFLAAVAGKTFQYGLWYDVEYESTIINLDKATRTAKTLEALNVLQASGRYAGLYASTDMINNRMDYPKLAAFDLWVAQYASKCTCKRAYGLWQYSSTGRVSGISGNVDRDYAYKDYPSFVVGKLATGQESSVPAPAPEVPEEAGPPRGTSTILASDATKGDLKTIIGLADTLGLYVTGKLTIGPVTSGDFNSMKALLDSLGIKFDTV